MAHIGVLKALERGRIAVDLLSGTSMGGLVAASHASGVSADELEQEALRMSSVRRLLALIDRTLPRRGLFQGQRVMDYLNTWLEDRTFDDLRTPLALVAVDLNTRQQVVLRQGRVADAVRATIAVPGLFTPVERDGQSLVDGGLLNNLPIDVVRAMGANVAIAVDVHANGMSTSYFKSSRHRYMPSGLAETLHVLAASLIVMMAEIGRHRLALAPPDVLIHPDIPPDITVLTGFTRAAEIIAAGEQAAESKLPEIRRRLRIVA